MLLTASDDGTVRLWGPRQIPITTKTPPSQGMMTKYGNYINLQPN